ncbi:hypothetical protein JYU34_003972 [Plutella xylostella]|uniref:G-protein coupled receptors family 3 profile domain-containing protein n=1 Tax=Plutella xylostella TaxID=51655 RepID=A0ABQ7QWY8_PLUXY|nr:hypothetical protein JYU34_003972 [Plutella xylostella]
MCVLQAASEPLLGVLGPGASAAAAQVQNLLQLFAIPQVSYSATARELSDRARYATFFRVVPSDRHQARAAAALLAAHNWSYVHALHTDESYGQSGAAVFREEAARAGVCVARQEALRAAPAPAAVDALLARLAAARPASRVAVCWCEGRTARALLAGLARAGARLRLVATDGWADRGDVVAGLEAAARGSLTLRIRSPYLKHFDAYYHALRPDTNHRNPWFREFWEYKFNCSLEEIPPDGVRRCNGSESLAAGYRQEPKLALVVRGVLALAHALHAMREALCPPPPAGPRAPLCAAMLPFNVSLYQRYLAAVRFRAPDGGVVAFDRNGDPPPELSEYDVMTLAGSAARGWRYERVGRWRGGALRLRGGAAAAARRAAGWAARCSAPCRAGQYPRGGRCCWTCVPCAPHAVTRAPPRAGCRACPPGSRPDATRTVCLPSPIEWGGGSGGLWARRGAAAAGGVGLAATAGAGAALWRHRATPVVKSASRELCALLVGCAALCHAAALAAAARPGAVGCALVRLAAPALGGVYASLLLRTARVARLVAGGPRPRLVSSRAAVLGWAALVAPGVLAAALAQWLWPAAPRVLHPTRARSVLACGGESAPAQLLPLAPALALLLACTALAVRTRRLPHNFNETRFLGAAAYATCVTWLAWAPLYAGAEAAARWPALGGAVSAAAGGALLLALGPRVWVCVCRPQRNTRAHFLTASIRCHLGKYRPDSSAPADSHASTKVIQRDVSVQTEGAAGAAGAGAARAGAACWAAGACARVTQRAGPRDTLTVTIALLHHTHTAPAPVAAPAPVPGPAAIAASATVAAPVDDAAPTTLL